MISNVKSLFKWNRYWMKDKYYLMWNSRFKKLISKCTSTWSFWFLTRRKTCSWIAYDMHHSKTQISPMKIGMFRLLNNIQAKSENSSIDSFATFLFVHFLGEATKKIAFVWSMRKAAWIRWIFSIFKFFE